MNHKTLGTHLKREWLLLLPAALVTTCTPSEPPSVPVTIQLADHSTASVIPNPAGAGDIVAGNIVIDFDDSLSIDAIDAELETLQLQRIAFVGGINLVTAQLRVGQSEQDAQAAVESSASVEGVVLNHVLDITATAGTTSPVLDTPGGDPPFVYSDVELFVNWPHLVMDSFPAHALADAVLGGPTLSDVVLAVVDKGGFQTSRVASGPASREGSLMSGTSDTDLAPRLVSPTGIAVDQITGVGNMQVGTNDASSNSLIGAPGSSLHGLEVASAAVGGGQDIIGTGRHAKFRPVRISRILSMGRCSNDRSIACDQSTPCPEGMGQCDEVISTIDYLNAAIMLLADEADPNVKVVNFSVGFKINNDEERQRVRSVLTRSFGRLIDGGRIVVVSGGNDGVDTADYAFAAVGPERGLSRQSAGNGVEKAMLVVSSSTLPEGNSLDVLFEIPDPTLDFAGRTEAHDASAATGDHVRISAPGNFVPVLDEDFTSRRATGGTSFSAPYVAGLAAEMFAVDPTATNVEIVDIIERTADDLGEPGPDASFGYGRINCWKAILTLLNRDRPEDDPEWLGIRFRFALEADDTLQFTIDGNPVAANVGLRRVPDVAQDMDDNSREVPSPDILPASVAAQFSFMTVDLFSGNDGVSVFKVATETGRNVYEIPFRLADLLGELPVDSSLDDHVLTLDIHTRSAAVYGRVTSEGDAVSGATVRYLALDGSDGAVQADEFGYYAIYDAMPDTEFEMAASSGNLITEALDITVPELTALRQDFELIKSEFPKTFVGTGTRTLTAEWDFLGGGEATSVQRLDVTLTVQESGEITGVFSTPDGEVNEVPIIGRPGETETIINNNQWIDFTCPNDAERNAGETVTLIQYSFGSVGWGGEWEENGDYEIKFRAVAYDMFINGSFSEISLSGSGAWPDAERFPRGAEFHSFICSPFESTTYSRFEWEVTAQRIEDTDN